MKKKQETTPPQPLVVTTLHKGVFFGYGVTTELKEPNKSIRLTEAQMCIYWSEDLKGVMGLASTGPNNHCKVSFVVPAITLIEVTSVMECSQQAETAWKQLA